VPCTFKLPLSIMLEVLITMLEPVGVIVATVALLAPIICTPTGVTAIPFVEPDRIKILLLDCSRKPDPSGLAPSCVPVPTFKIPVTVVIGASMMMEDFEVDAIGVKYRSPLLLGSWVQRPEVEHSCTLFVEDRPVAVIPDVALTCWYRFMLTFPVPGKLRRDTGEVLLELDSGMLLDKLKRLLNPDNNCV